MPDKSGPFGPGMVDFLTDLERNNRRDWFDRNKARYEELVLEPALEFIEAMAPHVERISPHLRAVARRTGGSLMRIHRDVRFSLDKRPYKTNLGIQFRHEAGRDVHAPGLYFHVEPGRAFLGAGMWRPDPAALAAVRRAMVEDPVGWRRVRDRKRFRARWRIDGERLKRPPRGFDPDHPLVEDLKLKDAIAVCDLTLDDVLGASAIRRVAERFDRSRAFLGWLAGAVGLPF